MQLQRGPIVLSLLPAFEYLTFIAIHQAGTVPSLLRLRIAAVSEPLSNGSFAHAKRNAACKITQQGPVAQPTLPRSFVSPNNPWGFWSWQRAVTHKTEDGIAAGGQMQVFAQACSSLATQSKTEYAQRLLQSKRALGMGKGEERKPLSEDFTPTGHFGTKEAADFHTQMKRSFATGKIVSMPAVTTLHPFGLGPTTRTESRWGRSSQRHRDLVGDLDLLDHCIRELGKHDHRRHSKERGCVRVKLWSWSPLLPPIIIK